MNRNFPIALLFFFAHALMAIPRGIGAFLMRIFHGRGWSYEYYLVEYPMLTFGLGCLLLLALGYII